MILALVAWLGAVSCVRKGWSRTPGENRAVYLPIGIGFVALAGLGLTWAGALLAILLINLLRDHQPATRMSQWYPALLMALLYAWLPPLLPEQATHQIGLAIISLGIATGCWSWVSWAKWPGPWSLWWIEKPWKIGIWEQKKDLSAGQLNANHMQAVSLVATAAGIGFVLFVSPWWLFALPVLVSPIWMGNWFDQQVVPSHASIGLTQGVVHLFHLVYFGIIPLMTDAWILWILLPVYLIVTVPLVSYAVKHPIAIDSGRCRMWYVMLLGGWWKQPWIVRLLGQGWGAWWQGHDMMTKVKQAGGHKSELPLWSCAHNDYVQMLLEHGAIGLVCLLGFIGERLYVTSLHDPITYLMGVAICSVAMTSFPWTLYHETYSPDEGGVMTFGVGSTPLNVITLLIAVLAGRSL